MAWEQRSGSSYYYRKERRGKRVVSRYIGGGLIGQICADNDAQERQKRKMEHSFLKADRLQEEETDAHMEYATHLIKSIVETCLMAAGIHNHRGEWRRKRDGHKKIENK